MCVVQLEIGKKSSAHSRVMFVIGSLMFLLATAHVSINQYRTVEGYVNNSTTRGGPIVFLGPLSSWHQVSKDVLYVTISIFGDAVAVYRAWIVWNRSYLVAALPTVLFIVSTISGYMVCSLLSHIPPTVHVFSPIFENWIKTFYAVAVVQNALTAGLIIYKIWTTARESSSYRVGRDQFMPIVKILVESAALYLAAEVVLLFVYVGGSNAQSVVQDSIPAIVTITFCLVTVRIAMRSHEDHYGSTIGSRGTGSNQARGIFSSVPMGHTVRITPHSTNDSSYGRRNETDKPEIV